MSHDDEPRRPTLRVIRGDASAEEIAALLAVVAVLRSRSAPAADRTGEAPTSVWSERGATLRRPLQPGPGAWRASAWQR